MHIVVIHNWQNSAEAAAGVIAEALGIIPFEARQKVAGDGPTILANFADQVRAEDLAARLSRGGVPAFIIDSIAMRKKMKPFNVCHFVPGEQVLTVKSSDGTVSDIQYDTINLLLVATGGSGQIQTTGTVAERKFSLGKTFLAGGLPMSKKVTREETLTTEDRDETLWLYSSGQAPVIFDRAEISYDGFGDAMQLTRDLNFNFLKKELQRLAPQAIYDDRLLRRAGLVSILGQNLSPESDLDLAFEILSRSLRPEQPSTPLNVDD